MKTLMMAVLASFAAAAAVAQPVTNGIVSVAPASATQSAPMHLL